MSVDLTQLSPREREVARAVWLECIDYFHGQGFISLSRYEDTRTRRDEPARRWPLTTTRPREMYKAGYGYRVNDRRLEYKPVGNETWHQVTGTTAVTVAIYQELERLGFEEEISE